MTTALAMAARYGHDGQRMRDRERIHLADACRDEGARRERLDERDLTRWTFSDGSAIVVDESGGAWDVRPDGCSGWCWEESGCSCAEDEAAELEAGVDPFDGRDAAGPDGWGR